MRSLLLAMLALAPFALAAPASADAIMPFDGECPPGLARAIRDHAEVCVPSACRSGHDCGEGASCETLFECWAPRAFTDHRMADAEPVMVDAPIGRCAEGHHCSEGVCRERRQCEPMEATAAWDPRERRWTRETYVAASGCSAGRRSGSSVPWLSLAALLALARRAR